MISPDILTPPPVTRHPLITATLAGSISVPLTCREDWRECCNRWDASKADSLHHATLGEIQKHGYCDAIESTVSLQGMMFFPLCRRRDDPESGYLFVDKSRLFAGNPCGMRISGEIMNLRYSYGGCERGKNELFSHPRKNNVPHPCENNIFPDDG